MGFRFSQGGGGTLLYCDGCGFYRRLKDTEPIIGAIASMVDSHPASDERRSAASDG
ncbi:MAG: hypothetical protein LC789_13370 [Actinobacteria bacterium]|nr:hypothetical protein [Actinomycetota bacterium]MCA1721157.1 hypothetical protein [Actinomycetota bacterium]